MSPGATVTVVYKAEIADDAPLGAALPNQGVVTSDTYPDEPTDDPTTSTEDDPTVVTVTGWAHIYDPPNAFKTFRGQRPVIQWEMTWINDGNVDAILVHVEDPLSPDLTFQEGSLGADFGDYRYDPDLHTVFWEGDIPGNGGEVTIWYQTVIPDTVGYVENQACAVWDDNQNGDWRDEATENWICTTNPYADGGDDGPGDSPGGPPTGSDAPTAWRDAFFGCSPPMLLGDRVFIDASGDGVFDPAADAGVNGVLVNLYFDSDHNNEFTPEVDTYLLSDITADHGNGPGEYIFETLCPGDYIVQVDSTEFEADGALTGYQVLSAESDPDNDTNNDNNGIRLITGDVDYGVVTRAVTLRPDTEPMDDGDGDANTNRTVDIGFSEGGCPPVALGDHVWFDENGNGWFEEGEAGINGVTLHLYRDVDRSNDYTPGVDTYLKTEVTETENGVPGRYLFDTLCPDDYIVVVDPGNFAPENPLAGLVDTTGETDPDDDINFDDNGYTLGAEGVVSHAVTLTYGGEPVNDGDLSSATNLTVDFGFTTDCPPVALGNRVFVDNDRNGRFTPDTERGIDGVIVNLYADTDRSGDLTPGVDEFLDTTVTKTANGIAGVYRFAPLCPGDYIVQLAPANFQNGRPLAGMISSPGEPDPDTDIDHDDNGYEFRSQGVVTFAVSLTAAGEPVSEDGAGNTNLTVDFGLMNPDTVFPVKPF
jgi:uncharacterized repeat protein (TIGR01451 family)